MLMVYIDWGYGMGNKIFSSYEIAKRVFKKLELLGIPAVMRPQGEKQTSLEGRISEIKNSQAHILISIDSNWSENKNQKGIETYYSDASETGDLLANKIQRELIRATSFYNRGIVRCNEKTNAALASLLESADTSIATLVGFSSNVYERSQLEQDIFKELISDSVIKGLKKYLAAKGSIM